MKSFIRLLKSLKTPAKYLLYFFIAFVPFYFFVIQSPELRDEVTKKIRLYAENYFNPFNNVKNRDLIKFVLMTQNKNINSKKPLQEKGALQNKLINILKTREVTHSVDPIDMDSDYWKISFKRCTWGTGFCNPVFYKPEWTGTEWTYEDIPNELNFAEKDKEQLAKAKESLREELDEYFYRPANLKKADPQKALNLYNQAKKLNLELNLKFKDIAVIEKCVEVSPFDGVEFLKKYGLEEEHDKGIDPYYVWKLAEDAASSERFGPPDAKLVLQLICHGSWVPAEIKFAVEDAYDNWKNQKQPDFNLCNSVTSSHGMMRCVNRASKRMEETKTLTYPKVVDHIWEVDGITILPTCTEIIWSSGDNVEEYEEKFPSADNFRSYPGQYWGRLIPLQPIDASWGEAVSWPQLIDKCNKIESGVPEKTKNFIRINDPKADHREDESNYTLLAEWGSDDCSKLVPYFSEHCKSLVFLSMNEGTIFGRAWNTYAYISQEEGDYIVPVTTGKPLDEVIKMIEQNPNEQ
jgi:hypothetical protein